MTPLLPWRDYSGAIGFEAALRGLHQPYRPVGWEAIPDGLKDPEGRWWTIHTATIALVVNTAALGDVAQQQPDLDWSDRQRAYTAEGWPRETGEVVSGGSTRAAACGFGPGDSLSGPKTTFAGYDPFGRVGQIVAADDGTVSFAYVGERALFRRVQIATPDGLQDSSTGEIYDSFGRLLRLREVENDTDQEKITAYAYAPGGQLREVRDYPAAQQKRVRFYNSGRSPRSGSRSSARAPVGRTPTASTTSTTPWATSPGDGCATSKTTRPTSTSPTATAGRAG